MLAVTEVKELEQILLVLKGKSADPTHDITTGPVSQ